MIGSLQVQGKRMLPRDKTTAATTAAKPGAKPAVQGRAGSARASRTPALRQPRPCQPSDKTGDKTGDNGRRARETGRKNTWSTPAVTAPTPSALAKNTGSTTVVCFDNLYSPLSARTGSSEK